MTGCLLFLLEEDVLSWTSLCFPFLPYLIFSPYKEAFAHTSLQSVTPGTNQLGSWVYKDDFAP